MSVKRYVCIHGHYYQPPRENPWLEFVEQQDGAAPYHDWNERITAQCYATNATARILDDEGRIARIVDNYARTSFDFGPTLLSWLERHAPATYAAILEADIAGAARNGGHGPAIAQAWGHLILPLANARDKQTQIAWGVRDFELRFGRRPEGMWLPECAVDTESLELLAAHEIRFTILAPGQAKRVRKLGAGAWKDVSGGRVDPQVPYRVELPSGRSIAVFFYDGPASAAVAFEHLLERGEFLADRMLGLLPAAPERAVLAHIATDGESYGHHHRHGDMALAYALEALDARDDVELVDYAAFLARQPPEHEVEIEEDSAWSCAHGVGRWSQDCGCHTGLHPEWSQAWREPLRAALDCLRDQVAGPFEARARELLLDPWAARDGYIEPLLDRGTRTREAWLARHARRPLSAEETSTVLELMEIQRHAMLMYTSCGWFFDEVSGLETVQILRYAARVIQLAEGCFGTPLEGHFVELLARAPSNDPAFGDAAEVWRRSVRPSVVDLAWVAAHHAVASLFEEDGAGADVPAHRVERRGETERASGALRLRVGCVRVESLITLRSEELSYAVLHLGDHHVHGGVRSWRGDEAFEELSSELLDAFERSDITAIIREIEQRFDGRTYSLRSLFRDEQRRIVARLSRRSVDEVGGALGELHGRHAPLMALLGDLGVPLPHPLRLTAEYVIHDGLRRALEHDGVDLERARELFAEADRERVALDSESLAYGLRENLERHLAELERAPQDELRLARAVSAVAVLPELPFEVDLRDVQNAYWRLLQDVAPGVLERSRAGDAAARSWYERFAELGRALGMRVG